MSGLAATLLSIAMIGVVALLWGGVVLIRRGTARRQGVLMIICATVILGNVLIWTV